MDTIVFRPIERSDDESVRKFLSEMGWDSRVADAEKFAVIIRNSDRTIVALFSGQVIGFGRALCDDCSNGYLSMIAVHPNFQRQGVGSEIVRRLMGDDPDITWVFRDGRGSDVFWKKMGFAKSEVAMERTRRK